MSNEEVAALAAQEQDEAGRAELRAHAAKLEQVCALFPDGLPLEETIGKTVTLDAFQVVTLLAAYTSVLDLVAYLSGREPSREYTLALSRVTTDVVTALGYLSE